MGALGFDGVFGGSGGAGRVMSVILVKHSGKTINVDNNYALAA